MHQFVNLSGEKKKEEEKKEEEAKSGKEQGNCTHQTNTGHAGYRKHYVSAEMSSSGFLMKQWDTSLRVK